MIYEILAHGQMLAAHKCKQLEALRCAADFALANRCPVTVIALHLASGHSWIVCQLEPRAYSLSA